MKIFNSLTKTVQTFSPQNNKSIKMYVCGITPYDTTHLGHAFLYVFFDVVVRYLKFKGYQTTYVQNVTDIDDDILKRATKEKKDWKELGEFWTNRFLKDLKYLNVPMPTHYVKATDSITLMIYIIKALIQKGIAYERDGNVYFKVNKFPQYGKLSRLSKKQMIALSKERGGNPNDPLKKNPLDFLLWQKTQNEDIQPWFKTKPQWPIRPAKPDQGKNFGRPGWHIECSAMINQYLGEQIDIHGGGYDLIYPHHESEIAQTESYTGKSPFVKNWMHVAMVEYQGKKMSKSLGNLILVGKLKEKYSGNAIRYLLLSHYYRKPWKYFEKELEDADKKIQLFKKVLRGYKKKSVSSEILGLKYFENDFHIEKVLDMIFQTAQKAHSEKNSAKKDRLQNSLYSTLALLGFTF